MRLLLDTGPVARGFGERTEGGRALVARLARHAGSGFVEVHDREGAPWWIDLAGLPAATDTDTDADTEAQHGK